MIILESPSQQRLFLIIQFIPFVLNIRNIFKYKTYLVIQSLFLNIRPNYNFNQFLPKLPLLTNPTPPTIFSAQALKLSPSEELELRFSRLRWFWPSELCETFRETRIRQRN